MVQSAPSGGRYVRPLTGGPLGRGGSGPSLSMGAVMEEAVGDLGESVRGSRSITD